MENTPPAGTTSDQPKVTLYWLEQSRSQRILWLLEELKVPYELKIFHRNPKTHLAPPELKEIHPLGKSPVISVTRPGSDETQVIAESANICEFLVGHFGKNTSLAPIQWKDGKEGQLMGETEEWLRYRQIMHYAEGSFMTYLIVQMVLLQIKNQTPLLLKPLVGQIYSKTMSTFLGPMFRTHFEFLEHMLETSPGEYLCATPLTAADIMMSYPLIAGAKGAGMTKAKYPKLADYVERLQQAPGYKKAVEKIIEIDGKYEVMF